MWSKVWMVTGSNLEAFEQLLKTGRGAKITSVASKMAHSKMRAMWMVALSLHLGHAVECPAGTYTSGSGYLQTDRASVIEHPIRVRARCMICCCSLLLSDLKKVFHKHCQWRNINVLERFMTCMFYAADEHHCIPCSAGFFSKSSGSSLINDFSFVNLWVFDPTQNLN
jgi:hypothetical protein